MRTKDLSDPKSWRAWDGKGFNVRFANPYTTDGFDPADHICEPISYETLGTKTGHVTYNTFYEKYLLVSTGLAQDSESGEVVPGFYFLLSDDLMHWSSPQLIKEAETWNSTNNLVDRFDFASLIDPSDTSRNFSVTGRRSFLYYVKWNKKTIYDRDLVRIKLEFIK
jgi:hypothetical protein